MNLTVLTGLIMVLGQQCVHAAKMEDYLDKCLSLVPEFSKEKPSPEPGLECPTFVGNSCCKKGATWPFKNESRWHNITDFLLCPEHKTFERQCHQHFFDGLCFFLCSPDLGPWIRTISTPVVHRIENVPLCKSTCEEWYNACLDEYTCSDNWFTGVDRSTGINKCHKGAKCLKYPEYFPDAKTFCEKIWDYSYNVVPDNEPCMRFSYDITSGNNPNRDVAERRAKSLVTNSNSLGTHAYVSQMCAILVTILTLRNSM